MLRANGDFENTPIASIDYDGISYTATLTPNQVLHENRLYVATLTSAIGDFASNPLSFAQWSFTTGIDSVAPMVTATSPVDNETAVGINTDIFVLFSEDVFNVAFTERRTSHDVDTLVDALREVGKA